MPPSAFRSVTSSLSARLRDAGRFSAFALTLFLLLIMLVPAVTTGHATAQPSPDLSGTWRGTLVAGQFDPLEIIFHITGDTGALSATLDIPSQSRLGLEVRRVSINGANVTIQMPSIQAEYYASLVLADDDSTVTMLDGDWSQSGEHIPLRMHRDAP